MLQTEITDSKASVLFDVSCNGLGQQCTAIAETVDYDTNLYQQYSYTTTNGGRDWDKKTLISSNFLGSKLNSLHCDDTGNTCTAIGWYNTTISASTVYKPLIYKTIDGAKSWTINSSLSFSPLSLLTDIFCNTFGESCIAVGKQVDLRKTSFLSRQHNAFSPPPFLANPPKPQEIQDNRETLQE